MTANWFLAGNGLDRISICARGEGHLEFKRNVSNNSDYRILVAPLGKLLRPSDVSELNEMLRGYEYEDDKYGGHLIPDSQKETTYLLTTLRDEDSLSPLLQQMVPLDRIRTRQTAWNFNLWADCPSYSPPGKTAEEVYINETPHKYKRDNFEAAYGVKAFRAKAKAFVKAASLLS